MYLLLFFPYFSYSFIHYFVPFWPSFIPSLLLSWVSTLHIATVAVSH